MGRFTHVRARGDSAQPGRAWRVGRRGGGPTADRAAVTPGRPRAVGDRAPAGPGSALARRVWTSVFLRHFTEPDPRPGVESVHPRYLYSRTYGWIDGQHFFGFIDFAEGHVREAGSPQAGLERATAQGAKIESQQQMVKDYVILGAPPVTDVTRLMQVRAPFTPLFVLPP